MKKRIIALITVVVLVMSLAGCGGTKIDGINMTLEKFRTSVNEVYSERTGIATEAIDEFVEAKEEISGETKYEYIDDNRIFFTVHEDGDIFIGIVITTDDTNYEDAINKWISLIDSTILALNPDYADNDLKLIYLMTDLGSIDGEVHAYTKDNYKYSYLCRSDEFISIGANFSIFKKAN